MSNSCIWHTGRALSGASTLGQSVPWSNDNEEELSISQNITEASPSDGLISHPGHLLGGILSVWRDAVDVFCSPSRLYQKTFGVVHSNTVSLITHLFDVLAKKCDKASGSYGSRLRNYGILLTRQRKKERKRKTERKRKKERKKEERKKTKDRKKTKERKKERKKESLFTVVMVFRVEISTVKYNYSYPT